MDIIGQKVSHGVYGTGSVTAQSSTVITVDFSGVQKRFLYPSAFDSFLTTCDPALQDRIALELGWLRERLAEERRFLSEQVQRRHEQERHRQLMAQRAARKRAPAKPKAKKPPIES